jgi:hypothetical protein
MAITAFTGGQGGNSSNPTISFGFTASAGDLIILAVGKDGTGTFTWPSPWVEMKDEAITGGVVTVAYLIASGGETDVAPSSTAERWEWVGWRIPAGEWHGVTPPQINTLATGSSTAPNPGSITPSWGAEADNIFIAVAFRDDSAANTITAYPANYSTAQADKNDISSALNVGGAVRIVPSGGSPEDPGSFTLSASETWGAYTIAVRPAVATTTVTGSFTADAFVKKTTQGSLTANAHISKADIASSFTADAFVKRVDQPGSFSADAFIKRTFEATFTADSYVKRVDLTGSFTADAYLKATLSSSFTANANISKTGISGSLTADAIIANAGVGSFTADAHISRDGIEQSLTADAYIKRLGLGSSFTLDAFISKGVSGSFTASAYIRRTFEQSFTAYAYIQRVQTGSFTADAYLRKTQGGSLTADAYVRKTFNQSVTADAFVKRTFSTSFSADAYVSQIVSGSFTADAEIAPPEPGERLGSFAADAFIRRVGLNGAFTADAFIARTASDSFTADAFIGRTFPQSFVADAFIRVTLPGSFVANAFVRRTFSGQLLVDAHIAATVASSFTLDAHIYNPNATQNITGSTSVSVMGRFGGTDASSWASGIRVCPVCGKRHTTASRGLSGTTTVSNGD